jgi:hypothetical protein
MPAISAYLSSADTAINLGTDTILLLSEPIITPIICDFTSTIRISKSELQGIRIQLNNESFIGGNDPTNANKDDITIFIYPEAQLNNALSDLLNVGTLEVDRSSSMSSRISSIINYKSDLTTEEVITLDIVNYVFGDYRLISAFINEEIVKLKIKETLNNSIKDKNIENVNSMTQNQDPIQFSWERGINQVVDNTMNIFTSIANTDSDRLYAFNASNNYTVFLSDLLQPNDTLSFVVTYTQNSNQKTFYGSDPPSREPTKLCITIIVTE